MGDQNFRNHGRYIPIWHFITPTIMLAIIIGSVINLCSSNDDTLYSAALIAVISVILPVLWWYSRAFSLRAQDRAIRAEENLRHFILTGKPLDSKLSMGQIIALRFAGNEEFPALAKRTVEENLPPKEIKGAIRNWRGDYHRA